MTIAYICDIILVLILLAGIVNGTRMGFVQSIVGLLLSVINIIVIVAFLNPVRKFLLKFISVSDIVGDSGNVWKDYLLAASNYLAVTVLIFLVLSIITAIILWLSRRRIEDKRIDSPTFAKWDRGLGLLAGAIKGVISCILISVIVSQPLFFPSIQKDVRKTTITSFIYDTTEDVLKKTTDLSDEDLTNIMISYFMGNDIKSAKEDSSAYRTTKLTAFILELPIMMEKPQSYVEDLDQNSITKYIIFISVIADITAMSPQDDNLDEKFIDLYDELVSYIPEGIQIPFSAEQFDDMFNVNHGSFYNVNLDDDRINKLKNISCYEICYVEE